MPIEVILKALRMYRSHGHHLSSVQVPIEVILRALRMYRSHWFYLYGPHLSSV